MKQKSPHRDIPLGDAAARIPVPPRDETFIPELLAAMSADDEVRAGAGAPNKQSAVRRPSRLRRLLATDHRGSVLAAAVLVVAVLLVLTLTGVPGMRGTQPPPATAADRLVAAIDAGLAKVETLRGVIVFDPPYSSETLSPAWASFAATSDGDRLADIHYKPDWAKARSDYRVQRAALRKQKGSLSPTAYKRELKDLESQTAVHTRTVFVAASADHRSSLVFFFSNPLTRQLARVKYIDWPGDSGLEGIPKGGDAQRVWELATQLRSVLGSGSDITVTDTTYAGRAAMRVLVPASGGPAAWVAIIDKQYGITLAVRPAASGPSSVTDRNLMAFHIEGLRINRPLPPDTFTAKPDYRPGQPGHVRVKGAPQVQVLDFSKGLPPVHYSSPSELDRGAGGPDLVPTTVPAGFRLAEVARQTAPWQSLRLTYRRGMNMFVVGSGSRYANTVESGSGSDVASPAPGIAAFDRRTWPQLTGGDQFTRIQGGALDGAAAVLFAGVGAPASLEAWTDTREVAVSGDLSRPELLSIASSMRPLKGGWDRSMSGLIALIGVIVALAAVGVTAAVWLVVRRRPHTLSDRPTLTVLWWPLVGAALVVVGAALDWHALLHNGPRYSIKGLSEPLGRWVVALALVAVVCAAWRQLASRWRGPVRLKFLAVLFATAALAGCVLALVYLPLEARFQVYPSITQTQGGDPTAESWLQRIVSSQFSPSATTGLYISIFGALFLFVGVIMQRKRHASAKGAISTDAQPGQ